MKKNLSRLTATGATLALFSGGCASVPVHQAETTRAQAPKISSLEISYTLGHSHRRVLMEERDSQVHAEGWVDRVSLKHGMLETTRFQDYFGRVKSFIDQGRNVASNPTPAGSECREPFSIMLKQEDGQTQSLNGCHDSGKNAFNRLVDDGEFLLFSSK